MLERNKKPVYYCQRKAESDDGIELFGHPEKLRLNYKALSSETLLETGGEINTRYLIVKITGDAKGFNENDRAYINVLPPDDFDNLCGDADYLVKSVITVHRVTEIIFEKRA